MRLLAAQDCVFPVKQESVCLYDRGETIVYLSAQAKSIFAIRERRKPPAFSKNAKKTCAKYSLYTRSAIDLYEAHI